MAGFEYVHTTSIYAAAALIAIGAKLRREMPVTATRKHGQPDQVIFWFEPGDVEIAQTRMTVDQWLKAFLCPWDEFKLSLDHPAAYLKAAGENRQNLLSYVKDAQAHAFRLVQRGNRTVVASAGMTEANLRRLVGG